MYVPLLDLHCLNGFTNIRQVEWNNFAQGSYVVTEKHNILCIEEDSLTVISTYRRPPLTILSMTGFLLLGFYLPDVPDCSYL